MRTTLTLDDDVATLLEQERRRTGRSLKEVVNQALRTELERRTKPPTHRRVVVKPLPLGRPLVPSLDCVAETLAYAEGEDFK